MIGAAAVLTVAGWCLYNFIVGWPSRYRGGVLYDRMAYEHIVDSLLQGAAFLALPLLAFLYQLFGYDAVMARSRKLGTGLLVVATVTTAGTVLVAGGAWLLQVLMETSPH